MKSAMTTGAAGLAVMLALAGMATVAARTPEPFFKGRTVTIYASGPPGSGYDLYARLISRHIGQHLPGTPSVVVSNLPGGGGMVCANYLYNLAAKDGTALGIIRQDIAEDQALHTDGVRYDVLKFNWIGRIASNVEITYVWHTAPVRTMADVKQHETLIASVGGSVDAFPRALNRMIGTKFKLVKGYSGTPEAELAIQRGEVEGTYGSVNTLQTTKKDWVAKKLIRVLVQYALQRDPALPDVPAVVEFAKTDADRSLLEFLASSSAVGRSVIAPPGVSAGRMAELRAAFAATMTDPEFLADVHHIGAEYSPAPADELEKVVARTVGISGATLARAQPLRY